MPSRYSHNILVFAATQSLFIQPFSGSPVYILFPRYRRNMSERLVGSRANNWRLLCLNLQPCSKAILFPRSMVRPPNTFAWMVSLIKKLPKVQELIYSWWQLNVSWPLFQESHNQEKYALDEKWICTNFLFANMSQICKYWGVNI